MKQTQENTSQETINQANKSQLRRGRRSFLRNTAVMGGAATGAAVLPGEALATEDIPAIEVRDDGYRMTDHIAEYYKSAKV